MSLVTRLNYLEVRSPYGYTPSLAPGVAYLVVFALISLLHIYLGVRYKYWVVFATLVPGGICASLNTLLRHLLLTYQWKSLDGRVDYGPTTMCSTPTPSSCKSARKSPPSHFITIQS